MATTLNYSAPLPPVNTECYNFREEWKRWIDSFEMFSTASKLDNKDDKVQRATLLHLAGPAVQRVFSNHTGDKTSTKIVKDRMTEFFAPKGNKWAERYRLKCRVQQLHESNGKFVSDLKKLGSTCCFPDLDEQIIGQIIEKCHNPKIREKLFLEGYGLILEKVRTLARRFQKTQESAAMMNSSTSSVSKHVHKQSKKPSNPKWKSEKGNSDQKCFACDKDMTLPWCPRVQGQERYLSILHEERTLWLSLQEEACTKVDCSRSWSCFYKAYYSGSAALRNDWKIWRLTFRFMVCIKSNRWSRPTNASQYRIKVLYYTIIISDGNWQVQASTEACNGFQRLWTEAAVLFWHVYC